MTVTKTCDSEKRFCLIEVCKAHNFVEQSLEVKENHPLLHVKEGLIDIDNIYIDDSETEDLGQ